jgi:hypothetical protein
VAGWQWGWHRWKERVTAVILICDSVAIAWLGGSGWVAVAGWQWGLGLRIDGNACDFFLYV